MVPALPPAAGWRAGSDPEVLDTLESIATLVRLSQVLGEIVAIVSGGFLETDSLTRLAGTP